MPDMRAGWPGLRRRRLLCLAPAAALLLAGCDSRALAFRNTDVTGADFGKGFELTDHTGQVRRLEDFRGKVLTIFFGFTHCPDVCPSTLAEMAEIMSRLGPLASQVQVAFITVDPERDTQDLLAQYVPAFHPSFIGLRGDEEATARTAKAFRVFYQKVKGKTPGSYTIDHTAGTYVLDRQGRLRLFVKHGAGPDPILADLRRLLAET
jgi:protein SCO1/2